ncbi:MAG: hypothetical protein ACAF41_06175 [Leptolyngbya sp. BL-A-14]
MKPEQSRLKWEASRLECEAPRLQLKASRLNEEQPPLRWQPSHFQQQRWVNGKDGAIGWRRSTDVALIVCDSVRT